jgi:hypothetical protein
VVLGPKMSAKPAVETLRMLAGRIENDSLLAGRTSGKFLTETIEGE